MIPYAAFMMKLIWKTHTLDVRVLNPTTDGVCFRVSKRRSEDLKVKPEKILCLFLDYKRKEYRRIELSAGEFEMSRCAVGGSFDDDEEYSSRMEKFQIVYELRTGDALFHTYLQKLLKDYMAYIHLKLEYDEVTAMEEMTGQAISDTYPESLIEWHRRQRSVKEIRRNTDGTRASEISKGGLLASVEMAICLDTRKFFREFLKLPKKDFIAYYWEENGLSGKKMNGLPSHPITNVSVTHIYIGNSFCPLIFPNEEELEKILDRAILEELIPVIVFSTMPEHRVETVRKQLIRLASWAVKHTRRPELVINDLGVPLLLQELEKSGRLPGGMDKFDLTLGPLLCKRKKDVRMHWCPGDDAMQCEESHVFTELGKTSSDALFYRKYLREKFQIKSFSYEACGYLVEISQPGAVLHLPLYQMNTSGYCTLYALCKNGDRGKQDEIISCPGYCEEREVYYPDDLSMIGRFNSLFGCSMRELNDSEILNQYIKNGIKRLVVRM